MAQSLYETLLDLFPLTDEVRCANPVFADELHREALRLLTGERTDPEVLIVLLRAAADLGYLDETVSAFLINHLRALTAAGAHKEQSI